MTVLDGWRPVHKPRTHELVLAQIEQRILDGRLSPGDRLPAERDLAEQLGVSRSGVREALRVLEAQGVLRDGIVVGEQTEALATLFRLQLPLAGVTSAEVAAVRARLDQWSGELGDNALLQALRRALR
ncbi:GntR family transcriptional regulator [Pseudonocardia spinosispora]|uniref:GntR family transcriptional regulator n=1 Tax=Pseudonocardia spinosispora TaxID=103441 RepID=UPI000414684E